MHDARDAEDKRLLEAKEHTQLLENYVYLVQEWAALRVRDRQAAAEVVQRVFLRLASELAAGKSYALPYRVVVWNVVKWMSRGYEWTVKEGASLPEEWGGPAPDELERWEGEHDLFVWIADLPDRQARSRRGRQAPPPQRSPGQWRTSVSSRTASAPRPTAAARFRTCRRVSRRARRATARCSSAGRRRRPASTSGSRR